MTGGNFNIFSNFYELKRIIILFLLSISYLIYSYLTLGVRNDHIFLVLLVNITYLLNGFSRRFIFAFTIFIVYWIIYDAMKLFPNYEFASVNIEGLYNYEKSIFGISYVGSIITPNEYFILNHNSFLDILTAIFYLSWVPIPLLFAFYLFVKHPDQYLKFALAFFVTNIIGFIVYYLYPAAPPWYVELHGFKMDESTKSYAAGLLRFDVMSGTNLFADLYSKGSNVFAAMPSLHSAYPILGLYYSYRSGHRNLALMFLVFVVGIWFSAIYLTHHYVVDVLAGLLCAIFSIVLFEKILIKSARIKKWLAQYETLIKKKI